MAKTYKVWIGIECHDDAASSTEDEYNDCDSLHFGASGEFTDQARAELFARMIHQFGRVMLAAKSDENLRMQITSLFSGSEVH